MGHDILPKRVLSRQVLATFIPLGRDNIHHAPHPFPQEVPLSRKLAPLIAMAMLFLLAACSSSKEESATEQLETMEFSIDETLLGTSVSYVSPALVFRPPLDWLPVDEARSRPLLERFGSGDGPLRLAPAAIFLDSLSGCVLVVSGWESDSTRWDAVTQLQQSILEERLAGRELLFNRFLLNEHRCMQSIVRDSVMTNYKLLLDFGAQLDYLVPLQVHEDQVERVESSIGTLKTVPSH